VSAKGTPATVLLARAAVAHTVHAYEVDPHPSSYGEAAAAALGIEPERMLKTLLAEVDGRLACAVVPVAGSLGQRTRLQTAVDETAELFDTVYVSAGRRGLSVELAPADLVRLTGAVVADLAR
jgi:Cys-tRNA(Pro)/Cys-tRNA(Cys) deacylase